MVRNTVSNLSLDNLSRQVCSQWKELQEQLTETGVRLTDAKVIKEILDDINHILRNLNDELLTANLVDTDDLDVASVAQQLDKLSNHMSHWKDKMSNVERVTQDAVNDGNVYGSLAKIECEKLRGKLDACEHTLLKNRENLEKFRVYQHLKTEIGEQLLWISEKLVEVQLDNLNFENLLHVESKVRHFRLTKQEISTRRPVIEDLVNECRTKSEDDPRLGPLVEQLSSNLGDLTSKFEQNQEILENSLLAEHFVLDCQEARALIESRKTFLLQSMKSDEKLLESCIAKIRGFAAEMDQGENTAGDLQRRKEILLSKNMLHPEKIEAAHADTRRAWIDLRQRIDVTLQSLAAKKDFGKFCRDSDGLLRDINKLSNQASSENFGKNLEEATKLLKDFTQMQGTFEDLDVRVKDFVSTSPAMSGRDGYGESVRKKLQELTTRWHDVMELFEVRRESLEGAKSVHAFDKSCDQVKESITEKKALFSQLVMSQEEEALTTAMEIITGFKVEELEKQVTTQPKSHF